MSGHEASSDINNLQEALAQQQQKISALREMVRKSDGTHSSAAPSSRDSAAEKVRNITKQLTQLKAKAQGSYYSGDGSMTGVGIDLVEPMSLPITQVSTPPKTTQQTTITSSGSEKVQLLRQQLEQNKLRLTQRASSKLHLEQLVSELKEKLDSAQQCLEDSTELGKSATDLSIYATLSRSGKGVQQVRKVSASAAREQRHRSATDLTSQPAFSLEKERIKFLENRCRLLEKQLEKERQAVSSVDCMKQAEVDLAEQLKLNKELENRILEMENLLQERQNEIETTKKNEIELAKENERLCNEISESKAQRTDDDNNDGTQHFESEQLREELSRMKKRITELEEINDILETSRCDLTASITAFEEKLKQREDQLETTEAKLKELMEERDNFSKASSDFVSENIDSHIRTEMAKQIQELQDANQKLTTENAELSQRIAEQQQVEVGDAQITAKITNLEATIESQREDLTQRLEANAKIEEELMEKSIELNVLNANFRVLEEKLQALSKTKNKPLFSSSAEAGGNSENDTELQAEVQQLKQKLDESNKAMIKLKLKCKQSEKQMEKLKKSSSLHEELIELQKTNESLQQRITELEDEKGQWQLTQMETESKSSKSSESNGGIPAADDASKTQAETIRLLEQQKFEQQQQLELLQQQLEQQQAQNQERVVIARVESEMSEIQLEEQLEQQKQQITELQQQLDDRDEQLAAIQQQLEDLQLEKQKIEKKLKHYINDNMELLDKVDKLSKSSSSAESIEIVDRLTQQERAEIDEFNKRLERRVEQQQHEHPQHSISSVDELTQTEIGYELSESLVKLREESSELMNKVAMFTTERREVLEKMETLTIENQELQKRVDELTAQKVTMETQIADAEAAKTKLECELENVMKEKVLLSTQVAESTAQKSQLSSELTSMQKSSEIVAALDDSDGSATLFDKCEKSLSKLDTELEAYRRANYHAKVNASKKLAKEAKNAHTQLTELLQKVKEASSAVETVTVVETVVAVTAPNGKALAEYEQLTAQNRELKATVDDLRRQLEELEDTSMHEAVSGVLELNAAESKPALEQSNELKETLSKLKRYEEECLVLKATVDDLREQLSVVNIENEAKTGEVARLNEELIALRTISADFDKLLNDKEMAHEQQIERFTRLRKELEGKCEVYEGEMEILQTLVAEQKQQLIETYKEHEHETNLKLLDLQQRDEQITKLRTELTELRQTARAAGAALSDSLEQECDKLRESLRINKALTAEQINELANKQETIDMLNQQLIELYKTMEENTNKVIEKEDEIADLEETIVMNKNELERLRKDNEEQKTVVDKLLSELHSHQQSMQQLAQLEIEMQAMQNTKKQLEDKNDELEKRCKEQLEKMKKFAANLKKRTTQCQDLEAKIKDLESNNKETEMQQELAANVVLLNERISDNELKIETQQAHLIEIQEALQAKTIELLESMENNTKLEQQLRSLRHDLSQRDEAIVQLKTALTASQEQAAQADNWADNAFGESEINELNAQLAAMKAELLKSREAASMLKQQIQEYETKTNTTQLQMQQTQEELHAKSLKFEKSKAVIKERNNQIQRLQSQIKELQKQLSTQPEEKLLDIVRVETTTPLQSAAPPTNTVAKSDYDALQASFEKLNSEYVNEKATFEQTIARLETLHDGIQAKLQEDMSYIETLEQDNARFKEKICKLEECVACFEERRASMERRANLLDAQMQSRTDEYNKAEDELIYRLNMLSEHDEVIGQRLLDSQEEKDELQDRVVKLQRELAALSAQHSKLEKDYKNYQEQSETQSEAELETLRRQLSHSETEVQRQRASYDAKLASKSTEIDELENEMNNQLARLNTEKRELQENLEKSRDDCTLLKDEIVRVNESLNAVEQAKQEAERELTWLRIQNDNAEQDQYELQELRMQSMQDKTELDNLRQQIETLANNHQAETDALRLQIAELDSLRMQVGQNQTDDQMFIETENKRLADLLAEKETLIAEYQRQNLQLQLAAGAASAPTTSSSRASQQPPDLFASIGADNAMPVISPVISPQDNSNTQDAMIMRLQSDIETLRQANSDLQRQLWQNNQELETVNSGNAADVIPAPPMFFAASQEAPSPFDEIFVQTRRHEEQQAAVPGLEQPTIEDLQRNVSDLEKYAQDLENKLAARNNSAEQELRRTEEQLFAVNRRLQELEQLQDVQPMREARTAHLEALLKQREEELEHASQRIAEVEHCLEQVERTLQARDSEIIELKLQVEAEQKQSEFNPQDIESQMIPSATTDAEFKRDVAPTLDMFFGNVAADSSSAATSAFEAAIVPGISEASAVPVVEEVIVPEKAYLCYPRGEATQAAAVTQASISDLNLELDDDAWGGAVDDAHWGNSSEEVAAEASHFSQSSSLLTHEQQLELQLTIANERVKELEVALNSSESNKQKLQEKLAKSMKVVSKYKTQNEEMKKRERTERSPSIGPQTGFFDDLDATIQDELKQQLAKLETEVQEQQKLQREAATEKEKLLKRIDMLTAGNERMSEMKERQDMDMEMYKTRITELQQKLNRLDDWGAQSEEVAAVAKAVLPSTADDEQLQTLQARITALSSEVDDLNGDKQELQALLDEERLNLQRAEQLGQDTQRQMLGLRDEHEGEVESLRATQKDLRQFNEQLQREQEELKRQLNAAEMQIQQLKVESEHIKEQCEQLRAEKEQLGVENEQLRSEKHQMSIEKDHYVAELGKLKSQRDDAYPTMGELSSGTANFDEMSSQLQEKEAEIVHLKQRIEDLMREDQTEKLVLEILTKNQEIHMLKMQVKHLEDDKHELEHNLTVQITKELRAEQQQQQEKSAVDSTVAEAMLKETKEKCEYLESQLIALQAEKQQMVEELNVLNAHVMSSLDIEDKLKAAALDLDTKNIEIKELRQTLEVLRSSEKIQPVASEPQLDVVALNAQWESVVEQRCSEIAQMWRLHMEQREAEFQAKEERFKAEIEKLKIPESSMPSQLQLQHSISVDTSAPPSASSSPASATSPSVSADTSSAEISKNNTPLRIINEADADEIITKMQTALESQEMEIVSLKEQLAIRSAEYARLAAQYDPFQLKTGSATRGSDNAAAVNATMVPKSELDLAMYMLHQRDMRCGEMELELVALLEERDTLQLKLSNTLRQVEAIKTQPSYIEQPQTSTDAVASTAGGGGSVVGASPIVTSTDSPTKTTSSTATDDSADELHQKLSQLQTVNHSKDKILKEEREHRLRQMARIQQDVAKMPTAAVSELIGTDISQTSQSPSSVLLNWLWGNKPPAGGDGGGAAMN